MQRSDQLSDVSLEGGNSLVTMEVTVYPGVPDGAALNVAFGWWKLTLTELFVSCLSDFIIDLVLTCEASGCFILVRIGGGSVASYIIGKCVVCGADILR